MRSESFSPRSIAIIGASPDQGKISGRLMKLLIERGFGGVIYPINPKYGEIGGLRCYPDLQSVEGPVDMVVLVTPAVGAPEALKQAGQKGVGTAVIVSAGFAESGEDGKELERQLVALAREYGIRLLGPNTIGFVNGFDRIAVTFTTYADDDIPSGPIAIVSQSGAFGSGMAAMARRRGLGMGYFVATGNEADLNFADVLGAVLDDKRIAIVAGYVEGLREGQSLLDIAVKALDLGKPVVLTKVGRSQAGATAAASHTGALAVQDVVFDGIARQYGLVRARNEEHLLDVLQALLFCSNLKGSRIGVVTGSGGAGVLIADRAADLGLGLPALSDATRDRLKALVPGFASVANPVDVSAQIFRDQDSLREVMLAVLDDPSVDVGMVWTQLSERQSDMMVEAFRQVKERASKPFVVCWVAAPDRAITALHSHGIAAFRGGEPAVDAIAAVVFYVEARRRRERGAMPLLVASELPSRSGVLGTVQAAKLLTEAGISVAKALFCATADEAVEAARQIGFPVALKIESPDILHKTEAGGIRLGLGDEAGLRAAHADMLAEVSRRAPHAKVSGVIVQEMAAPGVELVVGIQNDPTFGPVVMVGAGGILVEVLRDMVFRKAPVSEAEAGRMLDELRTSALLDGVRGKPPVDRKAVAALIAGVSRFGAANGARLRELDLNPVMATPCGVVVVDWLMVLD